MKKQGFTIIELLTVIIILSLIVMVVMPNVIKKVNQSEIDTALISAKSYVNTVNQKVLRSNSVGPKISDGIYTPTELSDLGVSFTGAAPTDGNIVITDGAVAEKSTITINDYSMTYNGYEFSINE